MGRIRYFLCAAGALAVAVLAFANGTAADPLDDARDARRAGDTAVLAKLSEASAPREARLEAIRQARWLRMPELALEPLARLAGGRDPLLAPEATFAAYTIAVGLDALTLQAHEITLAELRPARDLLTALARDATARGDLRQLAGAAARQLAALGER
jgi:hypothetical protein